MKKIMKKISSILLVLTVMLSNFVTVLAYDTSIQINKNIVVPLSNEMSSKETNYVSLVNELKNDGAVVSQQIVSITKEQFENIDIKSDAIFNYVNVENKSIQELYKTLLEKAEQADKLKVIAEESGATQEQIDAYNNAKSEYDATKLAYDNKVSEVDKNALKNNEELRNLIPGFNANNWKQLSLSSSTTIENKYKLDLTNEPSYYVLWIKTTINGTDYYQYGVYCNTKVKVYYCEVSNGKYYNSDGKEVTEEEYKADCEEPVVNICKIVDGKYYDNNGYEVSKEDYEKACTVPENPKTGNNISYIYAVLISLVALSSYVVVKKARKFSK